MSPPTFILIFSHGEGESSHLVFFFFCGGGHRYLQFQIVRHFSDFCYGGALMASFCRLIGSGSFIHPEPVCRHTLSVHQQFQQVERWEITSQITFGRDNHWSILRGKKNCFHDLPWLWTSWVLFLLRTCMHIHRNFCAPPPPPALDTMCTLLQARWAGTAQKW